MRDECKKCKRNHDPTSLLKLKSTKKYFQDDYVIFISGHLFFNVTNILQKFLGTENVCLRKFEKGQEKLRPELNE